MWGGKAVDTRHRKHSVFRVSNDNSHGARILFEV
jgi:hypothetical protein